MPQRASKQDVVQRQLRVREAVRGPDGLTFGERVRKAMKAKSQAVGSTYTQRDLLRDTQRVVARTNDDEPVITQQALSLIMTNQVSESFAAPAIAAALGVEGLWLQYGVGPTSYLEKILRTP